MATALIETIRVRGGAAPLWSLHLRRLVASCQALGIPFPRAFEVPEGGPDRVHRLEVGMGGMTVSTREVGSLGPVRLMTSDLPHLPYRHKTTDRATFTSAAAEAIRSGADEALLLTARGEVAEATIWCIFWWEGDALCAPALELGILPGVSRMRIAEIAGPVTEMRVGRGALTGRPIFLANAVRGVVEVATLDRVAVPAHPATAALKARFWT